MGVSASRLRQYFVLLPCPFASSPTVADILFTHWRTLRLLCNERKRRLRSSNSNSKFTQ